MLKITSRSVSPDYVPELSHDGGAYSTPFYELDGEIMGKVAHVEIHDMSHGEVDSNYEVTAIVDGKEYFYSFRQFPPSYAMDENSSFPGDISVAVGEELHRLGLGKYAPLSEQEVYGE